MKAYKFIRRDAVCAAVVIAESQENASAMLEVDLIAHGDPVWHREKTDVIEMDLTLTSPARIILTVTTNHPRNA